MDIGDLRTAYNGKGNLFLESDVPKKSPFDLFAKWFEEAKANSQIIEPTAMCLATASRDGAPSARFVLCKGFGKEGFTFFTHYTSRKGQQLEENPKAALTFYWAPQSRSIRIEGAVRKLPLSEADRYFSSRPYNSRIGALCSDQSQPIAGRHMLTDRETELKQRYPEGGEVPRPKFWGGYILVPNMIEFWQGQTDRIHDRIRFRLPEGDEVVDDTLTHQGEDGWLYERLQP